MGHLHAVFRIPRNGRSVMLTSILLLLSSAGLFALPGAAEAKTGVQDLFESAQRNTHADMP